MIEAINLPAENPRVMRGYALIAQGNKPIPLADGKYEIPSQSGNGNYTVTKKGDKWDCGCPDHFYHGVECKHIHAVRYYLQVEKETAKGTETTKIPLTHSQAWTAYNEAQTNEVRLFDELLKDLVQNIEEPNQHMGRPRLSLRETAFCSIQKVYSQLSSRRARSLFKNAEEREQINHTPHFNAISKMLLREEMTPILQDLIRLSAIPLAGIETDFAVDSTGFTCSGFGAYCIEKHNNKRHHNWVKAHICSGVKTNIVTDVVITDGNSADSPQFDGLIRRTSMGFDINEVSADKAYSSRANYNTVEEVGGQAYIPFRKNATARSKSSPLWKKAYHHFQLYRDEFDTHYHKRSNAESTIGAIKKKFGETLKSKKWIAQKNELLCKILAYNITVLIHEMFESGITPDFLTSK